MAISRSGALVVFGVSGDLSRKQVIPALYAMVKRGELDVPVIGVAFTKWSVDSVHRHITQSIKQHGGIDNQRALKKLLRRLQGPRDLRGDQEGAGHGTPSRALPCHSALAVRHCHHEPRRGRPLQGRARHHRETLRPRPRLRL
jgi:hypothetical protein